MSDIYLNPYTSTFNSYTINSDHSVVIANEAYKSGYRLLVTGGTESASFNLKGKYHTITGKFGFEDNSYKRSTSIRILGDDKVLKEFKLEGDALPQDLSINVKGVKKFTIEMTADGLSDVAFVNLMLK